jgi:catechol-2,3-dioxygenase
MEMPKIAGLGHVGLHVFDIQRAADFYSDVLGLEITDGSAEERFVFLSSRRADEHHELLLTTGRTVPLGASLLQQISFRCESYEDVLGYFERFNSRGVDIDMAVSHGNAIGIYFFDPERNRVEVYWKTGLEAKQPYLEYLDLSLSKEAVLEKVRTGVAQYGSTGYFERDAATQLDLQSPL